MVTVSARRQRAYVTNIGSGTTTAFDLGRAASWATSTTGAGSEALAADARRA